MDLDHDSSTLASSKRRGDPPAAVIIPQDFQWERCAKLPGRRRYSTALSRITDELSNKLLRTTCILTFVDIMSRSHQQQQYNDAFNNFKALPRALHGRHAFAPSTMVRGKPHEEVTKLMLPIAQVSTNCPSSAELIAVLYSRGHSTETRRIYQLYNALKGMQTSIVTSYMVAVGRTMILYTGGPTTSGLG